MVVSPPLVRRLALIAFLAALYLPALGASESGTHPDESYYLGISAEMDATGAWLTPTLEGRPIWFKPPLLYWAERVCYAIFGRNLFAARLPGALAAIGLALLTGALARRMYGDGAALPAALFTATTFGFLKFGRMAMMDAPMALAFAAAAYGTWRAAEEDRPPFLLLAGLGAGAATLLKGPVGAVLVLLLSGGFLALRRPRLLAGRWTAWAFALGAAIALPWFLLSFARHGRAFYEFFVVSQNLDRFRHPWTWQGEGILLGGFVVFLLPWTILSLGGLRGARLRDPGILLPVVWIAAVLLVFTVPALKWPHYGLACAPAAALLASRREPPVWARVGTAALLALAAVAFVLPPLRWPLPASAGAALAAGAVLLAAGCVLMLTARPSHAAVSAGAALVLLLTVALPAVNPPAIPSPALSAIEGRPLYVYDHVPGIFTLAAGRPVVRADSEGDLASALAAGGAVILPGPATDHLPGQMRPRLVTLARWHRIPGYLSAERLWRAWRERDPAILYEDMLVMALLPEGMKCPARPDGEPLRSGQEPRRPD